MSKIFKIIGVVLAVAIAGVLIAAIFQPSICTITRSVEIKAPAERIYPHINSLKKMAAWSPYNDPKMTASYGGPDAGVGAFHEWSGGDMGQGRLEIISSTPASQIDMRLTMIKPFAAENSVTFSLVPKGEMTEVTWMMVAPVNYVGKVMHTLMDAKKMVGDQFTQGLVALKNLVENAPAPGTITIQRSFNAPVQKVWDAWRKPELLKKWWGPEHFTAPTIKNDFKVGGKYHFAMQAPDGQVFWSTGTYLDIVPLQKLVVSDSFSDEQGNVVPASKIGLPGEWPNALTITITFAATKGTTTFTLEQPGVPAEMIQNATLGWNQSLDKLAAILK